MTDRPHYTVEFSTAAVKVVRRLPKEVTARLLNAADALAINPRPPGCKKLAGSDNDFRIRVGDYRIIYSIEDDELIVLVIDVGHWKDIYR